MRHRFWQVSRTQPRAELCASLLALLHTPRKLAPTKQAVPNSKPLMAELGCKSPCLTWQTSLRPNKCKLCSKDLASRSKLQPFQDMSLGSPRFFVGIVTRSLAHSKVCTTWRHSIALFGLKLREGTPTAFWQSSRLSQKATRCGSASCCRVLWGKTRAMIGKLPQICNGRPGLGSLPLTNSSTDT